MKYRSGKNLVAGCMLAAGVSFLAIVWAPAFWILPALLVSLIVVTGYEYREIRRQAPYLNITHTLAGRVARGKICVLHVDVHNSGPITIGGALRVETETGITPEWLQEDFEVVANSQTSISFSITIAERGDYHIGPYWIRIKGSLGILEYQMKQECTATIKVMPPAAIDSSILDNSQGGEFRLAERQRRMWLRGDGFEFDTISPFHEGDDPRRVDWRATARHGHLMSRRYRLEQHRDIMLLIDSGRLMGAQMHGGTKLDSAVDAAVRLSRLALISGDRCGLGIFDNTVRGFLPPQMGSRAYRLVLDRLYDLRSQLNETNFNSMFTILKARQQKRALVIILSDIADSETSLQYRSALATLGRNHMVLFAALKSPILETYAGSTIEDYEDVASQAVALRLLRSREAALHMLGGSGVSVLDTEPANLTTPLLNRFLSLRGSSRF